MLASVTLERPSAAHEHGFLAAVARSRALHCGLVTAPRTRQEFRRFLERARAESHWSALITIGGGGEIAGVVELLDVVTAPARSARLGYYALQPHAGRGFMHAGLVLAVEQAFEVLGLDRLAAHIQPGNRRSLVLVERLGFRRVAPESSVLKVGTRWRPHEQWVLERADWFGREPTQVVARA